jgi:hypothetical protein
VQCNALSEKLSVRQQSENSKVAPNSVPGQAPSPDHRNIARTIDSDGYTTEADSTTAPVDGVVEQIERGVYVTLSVSAGGKKDIRRMRFR